MKVHLLRIVLALATSGFGVAWAADSHANAAQPASAEVERRLRLRIPNAAETITVEIDAGRVTLKGKVATLHLKQLATETVENVYGVNEVINKLRVAVERRPDQEVARFVEAALKSDPATLALDVEATVTEGVVTLRGAVDTVPQKRIAEWVASGIVGVGEVKNEIRVAPNRRGDREIQQELVRHYATSSIFDDDEIEVRVQEGVVTLSGKVDSALEKNWAREEVWIRGVTRVDVDALTLRDRSLLSEAGRAKPITDEELRQAIMKGFVYDPRVSLMDSEVIVNDGVVTLRGTVTYEMAKRAAVQIAENTGGVVAVIDQLKVKPDQPRTDAEMAQAIRKALSTSAALARDRVDVSVVNGRATLSGNVDSHYEKWVAADLAGRTSGVAAVENKLRIQGVIWTTEPPVYYPRRAANNPWVYGVAAQGTESAATGDELASNVRRELESSSFVAEDGIRVSADGGAVTLSGDVENHAERAAAIDNAYQAGAREVIDEMRVKRRK